MISNKLADIPEFTNLIPDNIFAGNRFFAPWIQEYLFTNDQCLDFIGNGHFKVHQSILGDKDLDTSRLLCTVFKDSSESLTSDVRFDSICWIRGYAETTAFLLFNSQHIDIDENIFQSDYSHVIFSNLSPLHLPSVNKGLSLALAKPPKQKLKQISFFLSLPPWNNLGHFFWNVFNAMEKYKTYSFFDRLLKAGFDLSICSCQEGQYITSSSWANHFLPQGSNNRFAAIVDNESELTGDTSSILFPVDSMVFLFGTKDRCFDLINNCHAPKCSFYLSSHTSNELVFALGIKGSSRQAQLDHQLIIATQIITYVSKLVSNYQVLVIVDGVTRPVGDHRYI